MVQCHICSLSVECVLWSAPSLPETVDWQGSGRFATGEKSGVNRIQCWVFPTVASLIPNLNYAILYRTVWIDVCPSPHVNFLTERCILSMTTTRTKSDPVLNVCAFSALNESAHSNCGRTEVSINSFSYLRQGFWGYFLEMPEVWKKVTYIAVLPQYRCARLANPLKAQTFLTGSYLARVIVLDRIALLRNISYCGGCSLLPLHSTLNRLIILYIYATHLPVLLARAR